MKEPHHSENPTTCLSGHTILKESCRDCQKLRREWYSHIARVFEFQDIEKGMRIVDHKTVDDLAYRKDFQTQQQFDAKQSYFVWASSMNESGSFKSMKDQLIWEYHAEGLSGRMVSRIIGIDHKWCAKKISKIREYLMLSSQCAAYG